MKIYDVTAPIFEGMPVYKNKPEKQPKLSTVTNGHVTESRLSLDVHTGTHIDAPLHMIVGGDTFETLDLNRLVRNVKVFDLTNTKVADRISKEDVVGLDIKAGDFVLFKTKNSFEDVFNFEFVFVAADAAEYLANQGIVGVGIDSLGIERAQENHPTHKSLFGAGVIVIEGLRLKDITPGEFFMVAAPLKLIGTDASPARVLLIEGK